MSNLPSASLRAGSRRWKSRSSLPPLLRFAPPLHSVQNETRRELSRELSR
ncbi:hypothetical protein NSERUTF1_2288 [Nocardia seriolae]|nr:hypothetical protein NSERUTF1_2288 [Nocardia seriolae]